ADSHARQQHRLLHHTAASAAHLLDAGIPVSYTNVFWGGRSEIKPSEISPFAYKEWHEKHRA
ncbi:MAG: Lrp/AsnC family transcriptional regulator, partial [Spartobacteria bacterium]